VVVVTVPRSSPSVKPLLVPSCHTIRNVSVKDAAEAEESGRRNVETEMMSKFEIMWIDTWHLSTTDPYQITDFVSSRWTMTVFLFSFSFLTSLFVFYL
jgi:hypothetical protein